jgi:hypothetical protein
MPIIYGCNFLVVSMVYAWSMLLVFLALLPGHPQSVIYMLAERAADLFKLARNATITAVSQTPPAGDPDLPYSGLN